jgi:hypothetical protein
MDVLLHEVEQVPPQPLGRLVVAEVHGRSLSCLDLLATRISVADGFRSGRRIDSEALR